ncbi:unnamed protein product [Oikopleura dioica]|uniref:Uncharacterized protein n=1 Tax=Oikopleura dioica TaxID=34765 RepID=E4WQA5_OIKDI|nr:unnamed protein product [Oikopleura dioica]
MPEHWSYLTRYLTVDGILLFEQNRSGKERSGRSLHSLASSCSLARYSAKTLFEFGITPFTTREYFRIPFDLIASKAYK